MKKLSKTKEHNYLAKITKLSSLRPHSNADRLKCASVDGNNVIVGLDSNHDDIYVYFPLECSINKDFLSHCNLFRDKNLNINPNKSGFFEKNGRVKAIKLRGEFSQGFVIEAKKIESWFRYKGQNMTIDESDVGTYFDKILEELFCQKYIPPFKKKKERGVNKNKKSVNRFILVPNQFRLAEDTPQLGKFVHLLNPESMVSITKKIHGCNMAIGNVKCFRKLNFLEKFLKKLLKIEDTYYDVVYSSRRIVKGTLSERISKGLDFYKEDVWKIEAQKIYQAIKPNITLYGEVVGYTPSGSPIQKNYDYGCEPNTSDFYAYRMTLTTSDGEVFDLPFSYLQNYCESTNCLKTVPVLFYGKLKEYMPQKEGEEIPEWQDRLLRKLRDDYLEKKCSICKNDVWDEGIVLRVDSQNFQAFKFKSFNFLEQETKNLDRGDAGLEEQEEMEGQNDGEKK